MDRKAPDVALAANDILYIPDNRSRRNSYERPRKGHRFRRQHGLGRFDFGTALGLMNRNESERLAGGGGDRAGRAPFYLAPPYQDADEDAEETKLPLSQYFWILKRYRWRIADAWRRRCWGRWWSRRG